MFKYILSFDVGLTGFYSLVKTEQNNSATVLFSAKLLTELKEENLLTTDNKTKSKAIVKNQISFKQNRLVLLNLINQNSSNCIALTEQLTPRPFNSRVSVMSLGDSGGAIRGLIESLGLYHQVIPPAVWKKALGVSADKETSKALFKELVNNNSLSINKVEKYIDHNKIESILIAYYFLNLKDKIKQHNITTTYK